MKKLSIILSLLLCIQSCLTASQMKYNESIEWFKIGKSSFDVGIHKDAIFAFDNAIEANPQNAEAYYYRGLAYGIAGNDDQAVIDVKVAARLDCKAAQDFLRRKKIEW